VNKSVSNLASGAVVLGAAFLTWGCAGLDNPTALADLEPVTEWSVELAEVETMQPVGIVARVREGGSPMHLTHAQLEIDPPFGPKRIVPLEAHEGGYEADVRFYEPGEHHIHLFGQPQKNHFMREMGEHEIDVERQHRLHGDEHRFEVSVNPAPVIEGATAHITVHAFDMEHDGTVGHPAEGLHFSASLHMPDGAELPLDFSEHDHGEYESESLFPMAGSYELHIEIEGEDGHAGGEEHGEEEGVEFTIHVPALSGAPDDTPDDGGGHGH
jgi:hypothetical protein